MERRKEFNIFLKHFAALKTVRDAIRVRDTIKQLMSGRD